MVLMMLMAFAHGRETDPNAIYIPQLTCLYANVETQKLELIAIGQAGTKFIR